MPRANRHFVPSYVWRVTRWLPKGEERAWVNAIHREIAKMGRTYALQKQSEAYRGDFGSKNNALMPDDTIPREKDSEYTDI
jgi:hypothetical protein